MLWMFLRHSVRPFNGFPWVSRYQKGTAILNFNEPIDDGKAVASAGPPFALRSRQITTSAHHHSIFYRPNAPPGAKPTVSKH